MLVVGSEMDRGNGGEEGGVRWGCETWWDATTCMSVDRTSLRMRLATLYCTEIAEEVRIRVRKGSSTT